jgi:hypothetical protein
MKKWLTLLLCGALIIGAVSIANAEGTDTEDFTGVKLDYQADLPEHCAQYAYRLSDGFIVSRIALTTGDSFTITPDGVCNEMVFGWYSTPKSYVVQQIGLDGASIWEETVSDGFANRTIPLYPDCAAVVVTLLGEGAIGEVKAYAEWVISDDEIQGFLPTPESVDLLIITAEPGMEWKQFGAVLPTYAKERRVKSAVLYLSDYDDRARVDEALSGLISVGLIEYPIFGGFSCRNYTSYDVVSREWGTSETQDYIAAQIEQLSPKVIVTHGLDDASAAHRFSAECVLEAVKTTESVQKLYMREETQSSNVTVIPMDTRLNVFGGKTAAETAQAAYDICSSQTVYGLTIDTDNAYRLAFSRVGADMEKDDLFENIDLSSLIAYEDVTPSPEPTAEAAQHPGTTASKAAGGTLAPTSALVGLAAGTALSLVLFLSVYGSIRRRRNKGDAVCISLIPFAAGVAVCFILAGNIGPATINPEPVQSEAPAESTPVPTQTANPTPEPTADPIETFEENYYRKDGDPEETVVVDSEHGHWAYRSDNIGVNIDREEVLNAEGEPVVYFVADIHIRDESELRAGYGSDGHTGKGTAYPWLIARDAKAVLAITGDGMINTDRGSKGILIRDGRVYSSANAEDTLAFYPDMTMRIAEKWETRADILLDDGVENAFSFGPTLIMDGVINDGLEQSHLNRVNARAGIGYVEPGHYIAIVVERWSNAYSVGMSLTEFAELFAENSCENAYNLIGGWSAAMVFMGTQLNGHVIQEIGEAGYGVGQRPIADALMFGYSELVPDAGQ